jgi:hypothetical protein
MKRRSSQTATHATTRRLSVPAADWLLEMLDGDTTAGAPGGVRLTRDELLMLATHEGVLAITEHLERLQAERPLRRSDLVFRFEVKAGEIGRAARAESEARAINAVLAAATERSKT